MIGVIDWIGAEQRQYDCLCEELEQRAEDDAHRTVNDPASRPDIPDVTPRCARQSSPHQDQSASNEGHAGEWDRECDDPPHRPESPQTLAPCGNEVSGAGLDGSLNAGHASSLS